MDDKATKRILANLQRRLDAVALEQLREEVNMLRERLERTEKRADMAEAEAARAWDCADEWREDYFNTAEQMCAELGAQPGLTKSGHIVPVKNDEEAN